jgi:uroporphyrinogen-III synthase
MKEFRAHILCTRPVGKKAVLEAAEHKIDLEEISFIQTQSAVDTQMEERIRELLQKDITAIFTSASALKAMKQFVTASPTWRIYCTAYATRALAVEIFGEKAIAGVGENAAALADTITGDQSPGPLYFFCGDQRREELPEKLRARHLSLEEWVVYKTVATPVAIALNYDGILFFSPSAVKSFFSVNRIAPQTRIFVIGESTARSVKLFTGNPVMIAEHPGKKNLVDLAISFFNSSKPQ